MPDASVFDLESFCQRTAERAGRHGITNAGQELGRAVIATLRAAIDPAEWEALIAQLPDAYEPILS